MSEQRIFKVISLTRRQPIFLYKAEPTQAQPTSQTSSLKIKQYMKKIMEEIKDKRKSIQLSPRNNQMAARSVSCHLVPPKQQSRSSSIDSKSIKEYLKMACRRNDKRRESYKLPSIHKEEGRAVQNVQEMQAETYRMDSNKQLIAYAQMRKRMSRAQQERSKMMEAKEKAYEYSMKAELISAWQSSMDQY